MRLQTRMVQVASQKPGTQFRQGRCAKVGLEASRVAHKFHPLISLWISRYGRGWRHLVLRTNLALVGRVHRCVAKPPVSNVTEVIPNKPDVIPNTVSNAVSDKAGTARRRCACRPVWSRWHHKSQALNSGRDDALRSVSRHLVLPTNSIL